MKDRFVRTQLTLIWMLARETESAHEADWARFFDLCYAPMVKFVEMHGGGSAWRMPRAPLRATLRFGYAECSL